MGIHILMGQKSTQAEVLLALREAFWVVHVPTQPPSVISMSTLGPGGMPQPDLYSPQTFLHLPCLYIPFFFHVHFKALPWSPSSISNYLAFTQITLWKRSSEGFAQSFQLLILGTPPLLMHSTQMTVPPKTLPQCTYFAGTRTDGKTN